MEAKAIIIAMTVVVVGSFLISTSDCTPVLTDRDGRSNLVEASPIAEGSKVSTGHFQKRRGRYYMGYPLGGLGYGGATASASASASASSGGLGMGYGGYPYMYGK